MPEARARKEYYDGSLRNRSFEAGRRMQGVLRASKSFNAGMLVLGVGGFYFQNTAEIACNVRRSD